MASEDTTTIISDEIFFAKALTKSHAKNTKKKRKERRVGKTINYSFCVLCEKSLHSAWKKPLLKINP